jgi:three-Cys-motif partner protein
MGSLDLAVYAGREQAYVKHYLLEKYLLDWGYKVGSEWDALVYIDGFAGPWGVKDPNCADSSFGVATETLKAITEGLRPRGRNLGTRSILVEKTNTAFAELNAFAAAKQKAGEDVVALQGEFVATLPKVKQLISEAGKNPFKFFLLDPKGWKDIPMTDLAGTLKDRSCEVLVNLMTSDITRFIEQSDRANSYNALFGRPGVLDTLRQLTKGTGEQAECAVREYCKSLKQLCGFKYVSQAVILEPNAEAIRYFLIYATNHPTGVDVFKSAEMKAAKIQDEARSEAKIRKTKQSEFIFGGEFERTAVVHKLRDRYLARAKTKLLDMLKSAPAGKLPYLDLYCEAMAFPLVTRADLNTWLTSFAPVVRVELDSANRRVPSIDHNDFVIVDQPNRLEFV